MPVRTEIGFGDAIREMPAGRSAYSLTRCTGRVGYYVLLVGRGTAGPPGLRHGLVGANARAIRR